MYYNQLPKICPKRAPNERQNGIRKGDRNEPPSESYVR
jgi:hypothetical protein